ncbi:MAG: hypothetical protein HDR45_01150, partial [Bacteroides sp.]|nr:hypothetical protein [Bacteroides sp.]
NFTDVTFLIPIRVDSIVRLENLLASINNLLSNINTNIIVLEANRYNNHILQKLLPTTVRYVFEEDWDPIFHRTRYINELFSLSQTPIISIWDADIIISTQQLQESVNALRKLKCDIAFPYDGSFYDVPEFIRDIYIENPDISIFDENINKLSLPYGNNMGGGALFITRDAFIKSGKEDERFYGWGPEDWNRVEKWKILDFKMFRSKGPLYHLSHPRDVNGRHSWDGQKSNSFFILEQTKNSLPHEL